MLEKFNPGYGVCLALTDRGFYQYSVLRVVADKKGVARTKFGLHRAFENFISLDGLGLQQNNNLPRWA